MPLMARVRPGAECISSARGHRSLLRPSKVPSRKAPSLSGIDVSNIIGDVGSSTCLYIEDVELTTSPNVIWADLMNMDTSAGAPAMQLNPDDVALSGDVTSNFKPAKAPF